MTGPTRPAGFVLVLLLAVGGGYVVGAAVGPVETASTAAGGERAHAGASERADTGPTTPHHTGEHGMGEADGYSLVASNTVLAAGSTVPFAFTIVGPDSAPVTAYAVQHTKELHLIGVRRDGAGYQHVHPTRDAAGRWQASLDLTPGPWRLIADAAPAGAPGKVTPTVDVLVSGDYVPVAPPAPASTASVDGYSVTLIGTPVAGRASVLTAAITCAGRAVSPEPYLGARGHLVAVRESDLAYLHVHPEIDSLAFVASFPSSGRYRLFLDVSVDGQVRTAPFTIEVAP